MTRLGILTPASNTNLEPVTYAMLAGFADVSAHFSRFRLPPSLDVPIGLDELLPAAELLAEAAVDLLVFHGTAGSWTGPDGDRALCAELESRFGVPATTATLATLEALRALGVSSYGLAFPGPAAIAAEIARQYALEGFECRGAVSGALADNRSIGALGPDEIRSLVERAHGAGGEVVTVVGTNTRAAPLVAELERQLGTVIVDSTAATTWQLLRMAGRNAPLAGWGELLARGR